jgi:tetratricopeptide (TPR) repeat protein
MDDREICPAEYEQERKDFLSQIETFFDRNELQAVLDLAEARLRRNPGDLDARIGICRVRIQQGRIDEAREMLQEMEEILAGFSRIYVSMGDIYMKNGMEDSAEAFYRKHMALNPEAPRVRDILDAANGVEEPQGTDAEEEVEREPEEDAGIPSDFQTVTLAELYVRQGHFRQAEEILEKIVGHDPSQERAAQRLSEVREMIRREAAIKQAEPVIAELSRWLGNIDRLRGHAA